MKKGFTILIIVLIPFYCTSQTKEQKTIIIKNRKGVISSVKFSKKDTLFKIPKSSYAFFKNFLNITSNDNFIEIPQRSKNKKFIHEHYDQYYKGIKIDQAGFNFHYYKGDMYYAHGNYYKINDLNTKPSFSPEDVKKLFAEYKDIPLDSIYNFKSELIIKDFSTRETSNDSKPILVYKIKLYSIHKNNNEFGFINAHTGEIVLTKQLNKYYSAVGTFHTRYNGVRQAITHFYNNAFHLVDSTRGAIIHTWNQEESLDTDHKIEFSDNDNTWASAEHSPNNNDMGLDVHWALQKIYDHFYTNYQINSFDDNGHPITAIVRYIWGDIAAWDDSDLRFIFGGGDPKYTAMASLDVVAHEYGHAVSDFQIGWGISGNPRAFSEGLSDIWATIMEYRINPNQVWKMGEQIDKYYGCVRNLQNTDDSNARIKMANTYLSHTYNYGEEYERSGVFSHWFYLLVNGGNDTNQLGVNYSVNGIGMDLAEDIIVYAVFNNYLDNTTSYPEIRESMISTALTKSLFNSNSDQVIAVTNAWHAVGVGNAFQYSDIPIIGSDYVCFSGTTYTLRNLPSNVNITWSASSNNNNISINSVTGFAYATNQIPSEGTITATITGSFGTIISTKSIFINTEIPGISNPYDPSCNYQVIGGNVGETYTIKAITDNSSTNMFDYSWKIYPPEWANLGYSFTAPYGKQISFTAPVEGTYRFTLKQMRECGWSDYGEHFIDFFDMGFGLLMTPNPATEETIISIESTGKNTFDENELWDIEVYSSTMVLKNIKEKIKGKDVILKTNEWKSGVYFVRVKYKDLVLQGKLIVK